MKPLLVLCWSLALVSLAAAAEPKGRSGAKQTTPPPNTPTNYRLTIRDTVEIVVHGEDSLSTTQVIDASGNIRMYLLNTVALEGKTVREAEEYIEKLLVERKFLRNPSVLIKVAEYAPREILVNGAVRNPGPVPLPPEISGMDITEVITKCGGFTEIAKDNDVRVTRPGDNSGRSVVLRVRDMMTGRTSERYIVKPGDIIYVDERPF